MKTKICIIIIGLFLAVFLWNDRVPVKYYKNSTKDSKLKIGMLMYNLKKEYDIYRYTKKINMDYAKNNQIDFIECKFLSKFNQVSDFKVALKDILSQYDYIVALPPNAVLMPQNSIKEFLIKNNDYDVFLEGTYFPHNEYIQPDIFIIKNSNWVHEVLTKSIALKDFAYTAYLLPRLSRLSMINQLDLTFLWAEADQENAKKRVLVTQNELFSMKPDNIIFHPYGYPEELGIFVINKQFSP